MLDDGSHQMGHITTSFKFFYPRMPKNAVYVVEDLHTAYWQEYGGGATNPSSFVNLAKGFIDRLNADHSRGAINADAITRQTFGISFYDSVIVFEKGDVFRKQPVQILEGVAQLKEQSLVNESRWSYVWLTSSRRVHDRGCVFGAPPCARRGSATYPGFRRRRYRIKVVQFSSRRTSRPGGYSA